MGRASRYNLKKHSSPNLISAPPPGSSGRDTQGGTRPPQRTRKMEPLQPSLLTFTPTPAKLLRGEERRAIRGQSACTPAGGRGGGGS